MRRREEIAFGLGKVQDTSVKTEEKKRTVSDGNSSWIFSLLPAGRQYIVSIFGAGLPMTPNRW